MANKNIVIFQKHVRATFPEYKAKRNFNFISYGNQTFALFAATKFLDAGEHILAEFEQYGRKPAQRQALLAAHGVEATWFKKAVGKQRDQLLHRLCEGLSSKVEDAMIRSIVKSVHTAELEGKSSLVASGNGFTATYSGSHQKLEQSFKSLKAASDWLVQVLQSDKDRFHSACT